jgi:hypothetical protein
MPSRHCRQRNAHVEGIDVKNSGFRFGLPHHLLRYPLGNHLL